VNTLLNEFGLQKCLMSFQNYFHPMAPDFDLNNVRQHASAAKWRELQLPNPEFNSLIKKRSLVELVNDCDTSIVLCHGCALNSGGFELGAMFADKALILINLLFCQKQVYVDAQLAEKLLRSALVLFHALKIYWIRDYRDIIINHCKAVLKTHAAALSPTIMQSMSVYMIAHATNRDDHQYWLSRVLMNLQTQSLLTLPYSIITCQEVIVFLLQPFGFVVKHMVTWPVSDQTLSSLMQFSENLWNVVLQLPSDSISLELLSLWKGMIAATRAFLLFTSGFSAESLSWANEAVCFLKQGCAMYILAPLSLCLSMRIAIQMNVAELFNTARAELLKYEDMCPAIATVIEFFEKAFTRRQLMDQAATRIITCTLTDTLSNNEECPLDLVSLPSDQKLESPQNSVDEFFSLDCSPFLGDDFFKHNVNNNDF